MKREIDEALFLQKRMNFHDSVNITSEDFPTGYFG